MRYPNYGPNGEPLGEWGHQESPFKNQTSGWQGNNEPYPNSMDHFEMNRQHYLDRQRQDQQWYGPQGGEYNGFAPMQRGNFGSEYNWQPAGTEFQNAPDFRQNYEDSQRDLYHGWRGGREVYDYRQYEGQDGHNWQQHPHYHDPLMGDIHQEMREINNGRQPWQSYGPGYWW